MSSATGHYAASSVRTRSIIGALLLTAILASSARAVPATWSIEGRVVAIADGDTITILDRENRQHKIRLNGIDAPEKGQPFGDRSRQSLARIVFDKQVQARCHKRDRYGREVCKVMRGAIDANLEQLKLGMAWLYRQYANELPPADRAAYEEMEDWARSSRIGLWRDTSPVPPWDWRRVRR